MGLHSKSQPQASPQKDSSWVAPYFVVDPSSYEFKKGYSQWKVTAAKFAETGHLNGQLFLTFSHLAHWKYLADQKRFYHGSKRTLDLVLGLSLLLLLAPLLLAVALAVKLTSRGPVFYRQLRIGYHGAPFWIFKFRTMKESAHLERVVQIPLEKHGSGDPRLSPVGQFLRKRKLDELPQLLNVLLGEMSLVGPRPLVIEESSTTPHEYIDRFSVKPGITGLWQATCPNTVTGKVKLKLDSRYAKICSFWLDIKLLFMTIPVVCVGEGSSKKTPFTFAESKFETK